VSDAVDLVVVGAGVAGGALGTVMARAGRSVLVLERTLVHEDRVRGEWLAPWGVAEAQRLGVYDAIVAAGGHHVSKHVGYEEGLDPAIAEARAMDLAVFAPGVPGPLTYGHPALCDLLDREAVAAGARLLRGVEQVRVRPGEPPEVEYRHAGASHTVRCRLVAGADGRASSVRRQAGVLLQEDPSHHLMSGLLVEGADGWPDQVQTVGTEKDVHFLAFPQGRGRVRLYLCYPLEQRGRLAGPEGPLRFLEAFRLGCVPASDALASARPAGPCPSYANQDTWTERPSAPGVVLVGDAAGYNDPITGQGLSITLRDVRIVRDLLLENKEWKAAIFAPYAEERAERMRRLRYAAWLTSRLSAEFDEAAAARRHRARERLAANPLLGLGLASAFLGPEVPPPTAFTPESAAALLG
jgi:2-polyprenyl-6-methoxyphenol hydroxylase-like FAD-dependent oxidoreductase